MKKVAIYSRVATVNEEFNVIEIQENSLIQFAVSRGYTNYACYQDNGVKGFSLDRPGLNRMMADIRNGTIDVVIVRDPDRIARGMSLLIEWMDSVKDHGVEVIFANNNESVAESLTPIRTIMAGLK